MQEEIFNNTSKRLNELKSKVFHELLEISGRVFIIIKYAENVIIGKRGFTKEEKENGLILVLNSKMAFSFTEDTLDANLVFGKKSEKCIVPVEQIVAIYSPELQAQFVVTYQSNKSQPDKTPNDFSTKENKDQHVGNQTESQDNVVEVDFSKKRKVPPQ
ncbi:stringent starvation protein B-like protein [Candidatus Magnetoovum chiemensis]|nr:stringent starvation protein B-like protein [Candidatus Magnetoovum chiemensis]